MSRRLTALILLLVALQPLLGQRGSGALVGTVRVASGRGVASAKVVVLNESTSKTQFALSSEEGRFAIGGLDPSAYTVSVESRGFAKVARQHVEVKPQSRTVLDFTLEPLAPGKTPAGPQDKVSNPLSSDPAFYDAPQMRPGTFKDSVDAGGYSAEAQAQTTKRLLQSMAGLKSSAVTGGGPPGGGGPDVDNPAFRQAEARLKQALALKPDSFEANYQLAELYLNAGKIAAGIPYLEKAQRLNPTHYASGYDLALAYLETQNYAKARGQIEEMLRRQNTAELHNLLGEVEENSGNPVAAAQEFQRAAQMDPNEKNLFDWGNELLLHRAYEPAVKIFSYGVERHPASAKLHIALGVALYSRGQYDDAVNALIRATDLQPSDPRPYLFLGRMFDISVARADEVANRLEQFFKLQPRNALANYYYAMSVWKGRREQSRDATLDRVEALLKGAAALDPGFPDAHLQLGNLYVSERKLSEAIREYRAAIRIQPELAEAHYRLAQAFARVGEKARAEEEFSLHDRLRKKQQAEDERKQKEVGRYEYSMEERSKP